ncbi:MAG: apolipoprotein N-acyltransferase [Ruminococcaceae bacterium]|nr:apolipoprotein N-acyltransferase [Oscillospiraceae bacterium]
MIQQIVRRYAWLLLAVSGVVTGLTLCYPVLGFLEWVSMVPALLVFFTLARDKDVRYRRLYRIGFWYYFCFFMTTLHWFLSLYPLDFLGVSKAEGVLLVAICWLGLSLLQTIFAAFVLPLFGYLCRRKAMGRLAPLVPLLFAAQYVVAEWSQTLTWMGVPWARLALGQINYGVIVGAAALFGSYFITLAVVLCNGYLALALLNLKERRCVRSCGVFCLSVLAVALLFGSVGYLTADPDKGEPIVVAAVQGNVGSELKWTGDSRSKTYEIYAEYTAKAAAQGADIVLFPETFVPDDLDERTELGKYVMALAKTYDVTVFCGAFHTDEQGNEYNALFAVYPDGTVDENVYAKRHLVPFGEYVPWRPVIEFLLPLLADIGMLSDDLAPGQDSALFDTEYGKIGALLCFDSIYEELTRDSVGDGAELLLLATNDSWFSDSRGVYMHHAQARLRAIESGKWVVRAADTGISSVIAPNGTPHELLPPLTQGMALYTATVREGRTLYGLIGNLLVLFAALAVLALPTAEIIHALRCKK